MDYRYPGNPGPPQSAVFVDVENMAFAQTGQPFSVERLMAHVLREAQPILRRAYADWRKVGLYADAFHEHAFDLLQVAPANGQKNAADMALAVDAVEAVLAGPDIRRIYLVTGDSDFCPLVRALRRQGREVVCIAWSSALGEILKGHADRIVYYEHIAGLQARAPAPPAPYAPSAQAGADQAWRPAPPPRRAPVFPAARPLEDEGGYDSRFHLLFASLGVVSGRPVEEIRNEVVRLSQGRDVPEGEEFIDWLEQHPRIKVVGLGDDATVSILPAGDGEDDEPEDQLNAAVATENLVFLGAETQGRVLDLLHELLANRSDPFTRSEMLQTLRFRLREAMPDNEPDYDALNSVFHIFYRAHAFQRFAGPGVRNAPLLLKPPFRDAATFRVLHDRYLIQLAVRQGLDWTAEEWADVLHGSHEHLAFVAEVLASLGRGAQPQPAEAAEPAGGEA